MQGSTWSGGAYATTGAPYRGSRSGDPPPESVSVACAQRVHFTPSEAS